MTTNHCCGIPRLSSSVFDYETTDDGSKLRCSFRYCTCNAKWTANTPKLADKLSKHVGDSVDRFVTRTSGKRHLCKIGKFPLQPNISFSVGRHHTSQSRQHHSNQSHYHHPQYVTVNDDYDDDDDEYNEDNDDITRKGRGTNLSTSTGVYRAVTEETQRADPTTESSSSSNSNSNNNNDDDDDMDADENDSSIFYDDGNAEDDDISASYGHGQQQQQDDNASGASHNPRTGTVEDRFSSIVVVVLELDDDDDGETSTTTRTHDTIARWLPDVADAFYSSNSRTKPHPSIIVRRFRSRKQLLDRIILDELHTSLSYEHAARYYNVHVNLGNGSSSSSSNNSNNSGISDRAGTSGGIATSSSGSADGSDSSLGSSSGDLSGNGNDSSSLCMSAYSLPVFVILNVPPQTGRNGQVFCCTPSYIQREYGVREYCTVKDFVMTCQMAVGSRLCGLYIASNGAIAMEGQPYVHWPVEPSWITDGSLVTDVAGFAGPASPAEKKACDVYVILSVMEYAIAKMRNTFEYAGTSFPVVCRVFKSIGRPLLNSVMIAQEKLFPKAAANGHLALLSTAMSENCSASPAEKKPEERLNACRKRNSFIVCLVYTSQSGKRYAECLSMLLRDSVGTTCLSADNIASVANTIPMLEDDGRGLFVVLNFGNNDSSASATGAKLETIIGALLLSGLGKKLYGVLNICDSGHPTLSPQCTTSCKVASMLISGLPMSVWWALTAYATILASFSTSFAETENFTSIIAQCRSECTGLAAAAGLIVIGGDEMSVPVTESSVSESKLERKASEYYKLVMGNHTRPDTVDNENDESSSSNSSSSNSEGDEYVFVYDNEEEDDDDDSEDDEYVDDYKFTEKHGPTSNNAPTSTPSDSALESSTSSSSSSTSHRHRHRHHHRSNNNNNNNNNNKEIKEHSTITGNNYENSDEEEEEEEEDVNGVSSSDESSGEASNTNSAEKEEKKTAQNTDSATKPQTRAELVQDPLPTKIPRIDDGGVTNQATANTSSEKQNPEGQPIQAASSEVPNNNINLPTIFMQVPASVNEPITNTRQPLTIPGNANDMSSIGMNRNNESFGNSIKDLVVDENSAIMHFSMLDTENPNNEVIFRNDVPAISSPRVPERPIPISENAFIKNIRVKLDVQTAEADPLEQSRISGIVEYLVQDGGAQTRNAPLQFVLSHEGVAVEAAILVISSHSTRLDIKTVQNTTTVFVPPPQMHVGVYSIIVGFHVEKNNPHIIWANDADFHYSVYSLFSRPMCARSLFPYPLTAASSAITYSVTVVTPTGYTALVPTTSSWCTKALPGRARTYSEFNITSPTSLAMFALVVGRLSMKTVPDAPIPFTFWGPESLVQRAAIGLGTPLKECYKTMCNMLGYNPYPAINIVIMPSNYPFPANQSLGTVYISISLFNIGKPLVEYVVCELVQGCFNPLFTESVACTRYLARGISRYIEERVMFQNNKASVATEEDTLNVASLLLYRTLLAKLPSNSSLKNQNTLSTAAVVAAEAERRSGGSVVIPEDKDDNSEVEYNEEIGYFLMRYMSQRVPADSLCKFVGQFVTSYAGNMFTPELFVNSFFGVFSSVEASDFNRSSVLMEWFHRTNSKSIDVALDNTIRSICLSKGKRNPVLDSVDEVLVLTYKFETEVIKFDNAAKKEAIEKLEGAKMSVSMWTNDQIGIFLKRLCEGTLLHTETIELLDATFLFKDKNARVRKGWCEVVFKGDYKNWISYVNNFIINDKPFSSDISKTSTSQIPPF